MTVKTTTISNIWYIEHIDRQPVEVRRRWITKGLSPESADSDTFALCASYWIAAPFRMKEIWIEAE